MYEQKNAIITSVTLSNADHGVLSAFIHLDYNGSGQGFGGYMLYSPQNKHSQKNYAGHFIWRCLEVAEVSDWSKLPGRTIRVKANHSEVYAIGHIIKDIWFYPKQELAQLT